MDKDYFTEYIGDSIKELREDVGELKTLLVELKTKQEVFEQISTKRHRFITTGLSVIALVISFMRLYG